MEMKVEMEKKTYGGYPATQCQVVVAVYPGGRIPVVTMDFRYAEGSVRSRFGPSDQEYVGRQNGGSLKIPTQVAETLTCALLFAISPGKPKEFTFSVDESSEEIEARADQRVSNEGAA